MSAAALKLAAQGLPCFPCLASKAPACPHGFKAASCDPDAVRALWQRYPGPLIGVPTGERSGFDALDLDPKNGCAHWWEINAARVPETRIHQTRSGGWHLLFQHHPEVRNSQSKVGKGIDVRGEGGFIVFWPACGGSIISDADIAPWPSWLVKAITAKKPAPKIVRCPPVEGRTKRIETIIENALVKIRNAPTGDLHYRLRTASYLLGGVLAAGGIDGGEAASVLLQAAHAAGAVDLQNAEKTIASGLRIGGQHPLDFNVPHDAR